MTLIIKGSLIFLKLKIKIIPKITPKITPKIMLVGISNNIQ